MGKKIFTLVILMIVAVGLTFWNISSAEADYEKTKGTETSRTEKQIRENKHDKRDEKSNKKAHYKKKMKGKDKRSKKRQQANPPTNNGVMPNQQQVENPLIINGMKPIYKLNSDLVPGKNHNMKAKAYSYPAWQVANWLVSGRKSQDYPADKICFLTFDDGPSNNVTPQILDTLKKEKVPATFFVVGKALNESSHWWIVREINEGHSIAYHSFSHNYNVLYPKRVANPDSIEYEFQLTDQIVKGILGQEFKTGAIRYPGGHMSWKGMWVSDQRLANLGFAWVDWNISSGDAASKYVPADSLIANVKNQTSSWKNVVVVLMHDSGSHQTTADALPKIIKFYKSKGYKFGVLE